MKKHGLKVYGYTVVNTEGYGDGTESYTALFTTRTECIFYAYKEFAMNYKHMDKHGTLDHEFSTLGTSHYIKQKFN